MVVVLYITHKYALNRINRENLNQIFKNKVKTLNTIKKKDVKKKKRKKKELISSN